MSERIDESFEAMDAVRECLFRKLRENPEDEVAVLLLERSHLCMAELLRNQRRVREGRSQVIESSGSARRLIDSHALM